jgi:outer membrane protein TolC
MPQFPVPVENGKKSHAFKLDDCFNYSLAHSREYVSRKEDLYITTLRVTLERHAFEPRPFASTEIGVIGNGEYNDYAAALQAAQVVGVRQKLPYGGEVTATALAQAVSKIREGIGLSQSAGVVLEANIPLLRGAGMVAQEGLIQAERDLVYEVREFERFRRGFLVTIASSYFDLLNQKAQILNRVRNTESYIFIYQRTLALFKAGRQKVSLLDVQRAKQSALEAQSALISEINEFELKVDTFKLLLGMPTDEKLTIEAQFLSVAPPTTDERDAIKIASRLRLDLQTSRDRVDDATRQVAVAGNALLPDLNVSARTSFGTDPDVRTFAVNPQRFDYGATAKLDWALDRTAERNAYRRSQIDLDRAKRSVDSQTDQVVIEVRNAVRGLKQQQDLVALQKNNIALAQRRKAFAEIQFRDGKIDNRDYIDAESALLDAQNGLASAISALQIATLAYLRDTDQFRVDPSGKFIPPGETKDEIKKVETIPATKP